MENFNNSRNQALQHIAYVRSMLASYGNNDSEFGRINEIQEKLLRNEITTQDAISSADKVFNGKMER